MKIILNIIAFTKSLFVSKMVLRSYDCWGYKRGRKISLYELTLNNALKNANTIDIKKIDE